LIHFSPNKVRAQVCPSASARSVEESGLLIPSPPPDGAFDGGERGPRKGGRMSRGPDRVGTRPGPRGLPRLVTTALLTNGFVSASFPFSCLRRCGAEARNQGARLGLGGDGACASLGDPASQLPTLMVADQLAPRVLIELGEHVLQLLIVPRPGGEAGAP
jgi:hypothetical protein